MELHGVVVVVVVVVSESIRATSRVFLSESLVWLSRKCIHSRFGIH